MKVFLTVLLLATSSINCVSFDLMEFGKEFGDFGVCENTCQTACNAVVFACYATATISLGMCKTQLFNISFSSMG